MLFNKFLKMHYYLLVLLIVLMIGIDEFKRKTREQKVKGLALRVAEFQETKQPHVSADFLKAATSWWVAANGQHPVINGDRPWNEVKSFQHLGGERKHRPFRGREWHLGVFRDR